MKFFRIISDVKWRVANDCSASADRSPDRECVMPPIACPVCGNQTRDTRNPGFCYPATDVKSFPRSLHKKLDYGTIASPEEWEELRSKVVARLSYEIPILPCTLFGPGTLEVKGLFADCYPNLQLGDGRFMISKTALERLKAEGIADLFAVPVNVVSKRKSPVKYFELQIEHCARLHGTLDRREIVAKLKEIKADWARKRVLACDRCGREDGKLPERVILVGSSIPDGVNLFRLSQRPYHVLCTERFCEAAKHLGLTNILFELVKTDGSEKKSGFAKVRQSQPELWLGSRSTVNALVPHERPDQHRRPGKPKPLSPAKQVKSLLKVAALKEWAPTLEALGRPCLRFGLKTTSTTRIGACRFGGLPDLPKGLPWPGLQGAQLDFLLQINLAEIKRILPAVPFPRTGWLWFFYDTENYPWGIERDDRKGWEVLFWHGTAIDLARAKAPTWMTEEALLPVCALSMQQAEWLPHHTAPAVSNLKLNDTELDAYHDTVKKLRGSEDDPIHKLLGWPDTIQNDMAEGCAKLAGGKNWRLLLQLDSDENAGMTWGDGGRLYFWIREQDLAVHRFDRCWGVLQCY